MLAVKADSISEDTEFWAAYVVEYYSTLENASFKLIRADKENQDQRVLLRLLY